MNLLRRFTGKPATPTGPQQIVVRLRDHADIVLASGIDGDAVIFNEGGYYFRPDAVNFDVLQQAQRDDSCTLQGKARWFDVVINGDTLYENVGWRFYELKVGFEMLQDRIGFPVHGIPAIEIEMMNVD